jgi:hypothetical protein
MMVNRKGSLKPVNVPIDVLNRSVLGGVSIKHCLGLQPDRIIHPAISFKLAST